MRIVITGDITSESGVGEIIYGLSGPMCKYFATKNYGSGLSGVGVILMCQDPALNLKRRIRFSKKDKMLYMDIMLDNLSMVTSTHDERQREVVKRLNDELPKVLAKYEIAEFR